MRASNRTTVYPYKYHPATGPLLQLTVNLAFIQLLWFILQDAFNMHDSWWVIGIPAYVYTVIMGVILVPTTYNVLVYMTWSRRGARPSIQITPQLYRVPIIIQVFIKWLLFGALVSTIVVTAYRADNPHAYGMWVLATPACILFGIWTLLDILVFVFAPKHIHVVTPEQLREIMASHGGNATSNVPVGGV